MTSTFTSPAYDSPPRNRRHNRPPVSSSTSSSSVSRRVSVIGCRWMLQCWRLTFYIPPRFHLAGKRRNLTSFYTQVSESCIRPFSVYLRVPTFVTKSIILLTRWNKYVCMACVFRVWFFPWPRFVHFSVCRLSAFMSLFCMLVCLGASLNFRWIRFIEPVCMY